MKIVICGLGEVGSYLADLLVREGHELTLIDLDEERGGDLEQNLDATIVRGSATAITVLKRANVQDADMLMALTSKDEVNLIAASLGKALGAKRVIARCHAPLQREQAIFPFADHFGIDYFVSPERLAAASLAKEIRSPLAPIIDQFARGAIEVIQVRVPPESKVLGRSLLDLKFPPRMRVGLLQRGDEIYIPDATTTLQSEDQLVLMGAPDAVKQAVATVRGERKRRRIRLVVYGADDIGVGLLEYFSPLDAHIKLIDPDGDRCAQISEQFPWVQVICGQAIHTQLLLEENVMEADVFVAATRDDENNVLSCLQAAKLGIRPCLLTIHRPDYAGILMDIGDILGIQGIVSPRLVTGNELTRYVTRDPYLVLWELPNKAALMMQIRLQAENGGGLYGKTVRDVKWPKGVLLVGIERAQDTIVPSADDTLQRNDSLILLVLASARPAVLELFGEAM